MSKNVTRYTGAEEQELMTRIWSEEIKDNPYNYVMYAFPWGKKGTPLEHQLGPRKWQKKLLLSMAEHIKKNKTLVALGKTPEVFQDSTSSGRGIGKSALVAWLDLWMMSCILGSTTQVTANTEDQLKLKTWAELGKWHTMAINSHWFDRSALSLKPAPWFEILLKDQLKIDTAYYYAQAVTWSEENPDAFAGAHNMAGICLIFDEASGIPKPIWTVSEGFFTEPTIYRFWLVFSNPRRNTGSFFECFHAMRDFWRHRYIDSRTVEGLDQRVFLQIIAKYGEDSDEAAIEVKGEFPQQGDMQFISTKVVQAAIDRERIVDEHAALIMGVDPARQGRDYTVVRFRRGRNAWELPPVIMKGRDNMFVANKCAELIDLYHPDAVCIDAGAGTGVIDRLREMKYKIVEIWFGGASSKKHLANKRIDMWDDMKEWLEGGCIDNHKDLKTDLTSPEYTWTKGGDQKILESKEDMQKRGLSSPDNGDALSLTFGTKVARKDNALSRNGKNKKPRLADGASEGFY